MHPPSEQQWRVVQGIKLHNVQVIAVAGCGKTTTNLFIAKENPEKNVLLLTYNANLRLETTDKIEKYRISNLRVHTFHSFAFHFYQKCLNDFGLYKITLHNVAPNENHRDQYNFDIIILDEMQDMSLLYYKFFCKILCENSRKKPRLCLLGDPHQTIYQFNGSHAGYFINFPQVFDCNTWQTCTLDLTYRCTDQVGLFLNNVMLNGEKRISTQKVGPPVRYLMCKNTESDVFEEIKRLLDSGEYECDDIFVLAPSVRTPSSPVRKLSELCSLKNIPVFVSYSDDDKPNAKVLKNKLVFLTFHQCKGLERKVVFVLSFDQSYFMFFKRDYDPTKCPNEMYVAVTRTLERLIVVHNTRFDYLSFLRKDLLATFTNYTERPLSVVVARESPAPATKIDTSPSEEQFSDSGETMDRRSTTSVSNIIKKINYMEMYDLIQTLHVDYLTRPGKLLNVPSIISIRRPVMDSLAHYKTQRKRSLAQDDADSECDPDSQQLLNRITYQLFDEKNVLYENVSDINSLVIMTMFEHRVTGEAFQLKFGDFNPLDLETNTQKCAVRTCVENKYFFKLNQIDKFNWLSLREIEKCLKRLDKFDIHPSSLFEHELKYIDTAGNYTLSGRVDCYDRQKSTIWEFKCVQVLDYDHIIQTAIYCYMVLKLYPEQHISALLYNILDNQLCRVEIKRLNAFEECLRKIVARICEWGNTEYTHDFSLGFLRSLQRWSFLIFFICIFAVSSNLMSLLRPNHSPLPSYIPTFFCSCSDRASDSKMTACPWDL